MQKRAVVDSGPLIALFDKDDRYHKKAVECIKNFRGELISNCAVLTEVTHILDFSVSAQTDFLQWVAAGAITLMEIIPEDLDRIIELTRKYSDLPIDFADASLVVLCERLNIKNVISVDKDFRILRMKDTKALHNLFFS